MSEFSGATVSSEARQRHRQGRDAHAAGDHREAARLYREAAAGCPGLAAEDYMRLVLDQVPAALAAHRAIASVHPTFPGVIHMLGLVRWRTGDLLAGFLWIARALQLDPRTEGASGNLNNALDEILALARAAKAKGHDVEALSLVRRARSAARQGACSSLSRGTATAGSGGKSPWPSTASAAGSFRSTWPPAVFATRSPTVNSSISSS